MRHSYKNNLYNELAIKKQSSFLAFVGVPELILIIAASI